MIGLQCGKLCRENVRAIREGEAQPAISEEPACPVRVACLGQCQCSIGCEKRLVQPVLEPPVDAGDNREAYPRLGEGDTRREPSRGALFEGLGNTPYSVVSQLGPAKEHLHRDVRTKEIDAQQAAGRERDGTEEP
jgi:hypothetical protein